MDLLIAAHALGLGATLVTNNVIAKPVSAKLTKAMGSSGWPLVIEKQTDLTRCYLNRS